MSGHRWGAIVVAMCVGSVGCSSGGGSPETAFGPPGGVGPLEMNPSTPFEATATEGGPATPASRSHEWSNRGTVAIDYTVQVTSPWASVSNAAPGTLTGGSSVNFDVTLNQPMIAGLPSGDHSGEVLLLEATSGAVAGRIPLRLTVVPLSSGGGSGGGGSGNGGSGTNTPPTFTSSPVLSAPVGQLYSYTLDATGRPAPVFAATGLPRWLTFSGQTLSGTPGAGDVGTTGTIAITASNGVPPNATQTFAITVPAPVVAPAITSSPVRSATEGSLYRYDVVATGNPIPTLRATGLPGWLSFSGGRLSGTPRAGDSGVTGTIRITASNGVNPEASQAFTITVAATTTAPRITSTPVTSATEGTAYRYTVTATGNPAPTLSATGLPGWLSFAGGTLSGTPRAGDVGTTGTIRITASNGVNPNASQAFSVTVTAAGPTPNAGWTTFTPSADTRIVYVSSSGGSDSNDGLSQATPKASIASGLSLLRAGRPDWLLLRKGDTWNERFGQLTRGGRSPTEKMLISSYGNGPRPLVRTGTSNGVDFYASVDHLAIVSIEFTANNYDGSSGSPTGVNIRGSCDDILLEDLYVHNYSLGVQLRGNSLSDPSTNLVMRRCIIARTYAQGSSGNPSGSYSQDVNGVLIEGCFFYRSGHDPDVSGSQTTMFRHATYFHNATRNIAMVGNIVAEASAQGIQLRGSGSLIENNLVIRVPIAILFGGGHMPEQTPGGSTGQVIDNVILDGSDTSPSLPRRWGIAVANIGSGRVANNIIAHSASPHVFAYPFRIDPNYHGQGVGISNLVIEDNVVYDWRGFSRIDSPTLPFNNNVFRNNDIQYPVRVSQNDLSVMLQAQSAHAAGVSCSGNRFHSADPSNTWFQIDGQLRDVNQFTAAFGDPTSVRQQVSYTDPGRTVGTYVDLVEGRARGTSSYQNFIDRLLQQSRDNWDPDYTAAAVNDYIRTGFDR